MAHFTFQCPHCGEASEIGRDQLNQPAVCPSCGLPFTAAIPAGRLMVKDGEEWKPAASQGAATQAGQGEKNVFTVNPAVYRQNPIQTLGLVLAVVGGLTLVLAYVGRIEQHWWHLALVVAGGILALAGLGILATRLITSRLESLTITTQRTVWARGLINRRTSEVQHDDIRNIQVQQNLLDRFVKAGTVSISSAGQDDMEIVAQGIPNPQRVLEAIRQHQRRMVKPD
ncbi:MAG: PH domain-containing protein [Planctomycetota bacterium]